VSIIGGPGDRQAVAPLALPSGPCPDEPNPARIDEARRAATRNRLIGERLTEATAKAWIAAWDVQAAEDGLEPGREYWERGWDWIIRERRQRVRP
jgi:hypothetical protein